MIYQECVDKIRDCNCKMADANKSFIDLKLLNNKEWFKIREVVIVPPKNLWHLFLGHNHFFNAIEDYREQNDLSVCFYASIVKDGSLTYKILEPMTSDDKIEFLKYSMSVYDKNNNPDRLIRRVRTEKIVIDIVWISEVSLMNMEQLQNEYNELKTPGHVNL